MSTPPPAVAGVAGAAVGWIAGTVPAAAGGPALPADAPGDAAAPWRLPGPTR